MLAVRWSSRRADPPAAPGWTFSPNRPTQLAASAAPASASPHRRSAAAEASPRASVEPRHRRRPSGAVGLASTARSRRPSCDARVEADLPRDHRLRVRHAGRPEGPLRGRRADRPGTSRSRSTRDQGAQGHLRRDHRRSRATATSRPPTAMSTTTTQPADHPSRTTWSGSTSAGSACRARSSARRPRRPTTARRARPQVPAERDAAAAAAETFAKDCVAESGVAERTCRSTRRDRRSRTSKRSVPTSGVDKMDLYGLSYGTQFVQTYAAAHPDHIATLYVDGPVDLTIDGPTYYVEADALRRGHARRGAPRLHAPTRRARRDVTGGDALAAYDALAAALKAGPATFDFTTVGRHGRATDHRRRGPRDRRLQRPVLLVRPAPPPARDRRCVARRLPAARSTSSMAPLGLDPGHARAAGRPELLGRAVLRGRVPGLRVLSRHGRSRRAGRRVGRQRRGATASTTPGWRPAYYGDLPCLYWPTATTDPTRPAPLVGSRRTRSSS